MGQSNVVQNPRPVRVLLPCMPNVYKVLAILKIGVQNCPRMATGPRLR